MIFSLPPYVLDKIEKLAEVYVILRSANSVIHKQLKDTRITICSDGQTVLRKLRNPLIISKIVQESGNPLNLITRYDTVVTASLKEMKSQTP